MRLRIPCTLSFFIAVSCMVARGAPLTLDDCIRMALAAPSSVTAARQESEIARYGTTAARAAFLPQLQLANGYIYNSPPRVADPFAPTTPGAASFVALNGVHEYQSVAAASMEIDTSGRLRAAYARARADQRAAAANFAIAERDLKRAVTAAYFQALLTRHLVAASRDLLTEARSFAERTRALNQAGEAAEADVIKAESQVAFLDQALRSAELEASIANTDLAAFWTEDVDSTLDLADAIQNPPPPPAIPSAAAAPYRERPEFRLYNAEQEGFEADYRHERSFLLPQLTVNLQYGLDASRLSWQDRGQAAFFTLNIPIFDWMRTRSTALQFRLRAEQTDITRQFATRAFSRDYIVAVRRVRLVYDQINVVESQVQLSEQNLKLARIRYEGGEGPALDVVAAQTQLAQANTNYYTTLANYANARADLEVASGR